MLGERFRTQQAQQVYWDNGNKMVTTISGLGLGFKALDLRHKV